MIENRTLLVTLPWPVGTDWLPHYARPGIQAAPAGKSTLKASPSFLFQGGATVTIFLFNQGAAGPSFYRPHSLKVIAVTAFTCTGRPMKDVERHPGDSA